MRSKLDLRTSTLLQRVASWPDHAALEGLDAAVLRHITKEHGVDFATAVLFDRFRKSPRHSAFIRRIDELCNDPSFDGPRVWSPGVSRYAATPAEAGTPSPCPPRVIIVPGALYLERPDMGGDGRMIREVAESFHCRSGLVPLASLGSVSENARRLAAWVKQQPDEKLILVSLSKGGADLKLALQLPDAPRLFRNVLAWINVCGPLDGSPMVNWILSSRIRTWLMRFQYWVQRRDFGFISELRHGPGSAERGVYAASSSPSQQANRVIRAARTLKRPEGRAPGHCHGSTLSMLNSPLCLPPGMKMISLVGFPLRGHMTTPFSRFCHRTLSKWGPNDGTVLLSDASQWPGEVYPVWGADHFFRPENRARALITAVLRYVAEGTTLNGEGRGEG